MATITSSYLAKIGSTELPKIKGYKIQRNKLWTDAGRNMSGTLRATFTGIFPKIAIETAPLTETELQTLITLLDDDSFTLYYFDPKTLTHKSGTYYASDFDISLLRKSDGLWEGIKFSLVPFSKET